MCIHTHILDNDILYSWTEGWFCSLYAVPVSIYILSLPLPFLPEGARLSPLFMIGSLMLVLGLAFYYIPLPSKIEAKTDWCYYDTGSAWLVASEWWFDSTLIFYNLEIVKFRPEYNFA